MAGPKHRTRFLCELNVPGFPYVGAGNSTAKKDAEKNAAQDFVNFLVRSGQVDASTIPGAAACGIAPSPAPVERSFVPNQSAFGGPSSDAVDYDRAYRRVDDSNSSGFGQQSFIDRAQQQQKLEEAESVDVNAAIHGNWTIENARAKLNQFNQMHKIQSEFKYTPIGPDHAK